MRRFEELGIVLREKYRTDLFFRTSTYIGFLSIGFVLVCVIAFAFALWIHWLAWYIFNGILLIALICALIFAHILLKPIRDTLRYQKLFISNIAHELRTPLSVIKTSTEVALLDDRITASSRTTHTDVLSELDRVSHILDNLLSLNILNRPERIEFNHVDLGPLADNVVKQLSSLARERGIEIIVKKDAYRIVWGNATALEQIMMNLIKNAVSYTPKGVGGEVTILIQPDYQGSIIFSVSDTGIGISQRDLFHIFEPFYRADTSRVRNIRKVGSGLGLTIVNELVRIQHGKIHIRSVPRKGTTVSVSLPSKIEMNPPSMQAHAGSKEGSEISLDFSKKVA